jgi:hypothetical protein
MEQLVKRHLWVGTILVAVAVAAPAVGQQCQTDADCTCGPGSCVDGQCNGICVACSSDFASTGFLVCQGDMVVTAPPGAASATVPYEGVLGVGYAFACAEPPSISCAPISGSDFPLGTTQVTCTMQDTSSYIYSAVSCSFLVTVNPGPPLPSLSDAGAAALGLLLAAVGVAAQRRRPA